MEEVESFVSVEEDTTEIELVLSSFAGIEELRTEVGAGEP